MTVQQPSHALGFALPWSWDRCDVFVSVAVLLHDGSLCHGHGIVATSSCLSPYCCMTAKWDEIVIVLEGFQLLTAASHQSLDAQIFGA